MTAAPHTYIPTIDIGPWVKPDSSEADKQRVVNEVHHAATTYGFFQIVEHGVTPQTRQQVLDLTKRFFALPLEERMAVSVSNSLGQSFRGYEPSLIQTHHKGLLPDTKEVLLPARNKESGTKYFNGLITSDLHCWRRDTRRPPRRRNVFLRP